MNTLPPVIEMEQAYRERDATYDGVFFPGVRATAIFCRPACPARKTRPQDVEYFSSARDAMFAGYRPCKRCRPLEPDVRSFALRITGGACVFMSWLQSPVGPLVAGATEDGICLLEFSDRQRLETQQTTLRKVFDVPVVSGTNRHLAQLEAELTEYFDGARRVFSVPLTDPGTPFQRRVWQQLRAIPYGETRSYEDLAVALGKKNAVRAVGHANGQNRIAIVVPCHRVIGKDGGLAGYGGGLSRKQYLLDLERGVRRLL